MNCGDFREVMGPTDVVEDYEPNFEAWIDQFNDWQKRIGFDPAWLGDYRFEIKFDWDIAGDTIEFSLDAPEKKSMAQTLHEVQEILMDSTIDNSALQEAIADSLVGLDNGLEKISLERASIGSRLNIAESTYESNLDMEIAAKSSRSAIQDVDYAEASSDFAKQETALEAALASFPQVSNLSLFNYI